MNVLTEKRGEKAVLIVKEQRVDAHNSAQLKQLVLKTLDDGCPALVIDLSEVQFVDSSGLGALLSGYKNANLRTSGFALAGLRRNVGSLLELTRLNRLFETYAHVEEAVDVGRGCSKRDAPNPILSAEIEVPSQTRYLRLIGNIAEEIGKEVDVAQRNDDGLAWVLNLALTEAVANAIKHGRSNVLRSTVRISISVNADILCARVYDWGAGFDLEALTAHDFADLDEHGRGIFLIRAVMDSVEYRRTTDGNILEMRKNVA
jgi:serine/threonine-protein kinase RsbW